MTSPEAIAPARHAAPRNPRQSRRVAAAKPEALAPTVLSRREVEILNRLARPSQGLPLEIGARALRLRPLGSASAARIDRIEGLEIAFVVDGRKASLLLPMELINLALAQVEPDLPAAELDGDTLALLLELALAPLLDRLEAATGCRISLKRAGGKAPRSKSAIAIALSLHGAAAGDRTLVAFLAAKDAELLAAAFDGAPSVPAAWNRLPLPLVVRLGETRLKAGELSSLQPRDVVLFDETALSKQQVLVVVGDHRCFSGRLERSRVTLLEPADPPGTSAWEQSAMTTVESKPGDRAKAPDGELEALPITLQFEIGRKQIPLGELRGVGSGYVVDLGRGLDDPVDILANGSLVGRGEFVRVGESLGVRVTRLFNHE